MSNISSGSGNAPVKVMPAGLPYLAAGAVWFVLSMILPVYKLIVLIIIAVITIAVLVLLLSKRKAQIAKLPPPPPVKIRAEEMAKKIDASREILLRQIPRLQNATLRSRAESIARTLELIADEVERDPKDRNKVRKLANHYCAMITDLVEKYIQLEAQSSGGENISAAMTRIEEGLGNTDDALKKTLDDLFSDDAMEVNADIAVLEQLLKTDGTGSTMDFSGLDK